MKTRLVLLPLFSLLFLMAGCPESKDTAVRELESTPEELNSDSPGDLVGDLGDNGDGNNDDNNGDGNNSTQLISYTENFNQVNQESGSTTIIFAMDNSGSMEDEQNEIVTNINSFISTLVDSGMDFRIMVTSTNLSHIGELTHGRDELTRTAYEINPNQFMNDIDDAFFIGACGNSGARFCDTGKYNGVDVGSGIEAPGIMSRAILDKYTKAPNKVINDNDKVTIVSVSDETWADFDLTPISASHNMTTLINSFYEIIPASRLYFYSIYDPTCYIGQGGHRQDTQLKCDQNQILGQMPNATISDINQPYSTVLSQIGNTAVSLQRTFVFSDKPNNYSGVTVKVNGIELSSTDYQIVGNSLIITNDAYLISNSAIQVTFAEALEVPVQQT